MFRFDDATIELGKHFRLTGINWSIEPNQCWALVGPNGSGKSALIAAIAGEGSLVSGRIEHEAPVIATVSLEEQSALIDREKYRDDSDLTDEVGPGTSVQELLDEVCQDTGLQSRLISELGLQSLLSRGFRKLSTGETRKLLITRALTCKPDLLLLDEPYEGLDTQTASRVKTLLESLSDRMTLVFALNRIDEIPDCVSHVLRLENGQVAQQFVCEQGEQARQLLRQISALRSSSLAFPPPIDPLPQSLNPDGSLVSLKQARVAYTDNVVFTGLNWDIRPGEHWQVKGPNGSGKSCLLSLITGDHPQCYVNDISVFGMQRGQGESIWQIKQHLGYVSTALHWDYRLSVGIRKVILSGFFDSIGVYQSVSEQQHQIADAWLRLLGLEARANQSFSGLSFGEQRLVLIARAMVKHPALLLLDEPCLGLDDGNRQLVLALIERICEEGRTTLIYVSHHQEDAISHIKNQLVLGGSVD